LRLELREPVVELLLELRQPLVGKLDALARFFIVEQRCASGRRDEERRPQQCRCPWQTQAPHSPA
jgi:hypothetical protein